MLFKMYCVLSALVNYGLRPFSSFSENCNIKQYFFSFKLSIWRLHLQICCLLSTFTSHTSRSHRFNSLESLKVELLSKSIQIVEDSESHSFKDFSPCSINNKFSGLYRLKNLLMDMRKMSKIYCSKNLHPSFFRCTWFHMFPRQQPRK